MAAAARRASGTGRERELAVEVVSMTLMKDHVPDKRLDVSGDWLARPDRSES